MEFLGGFIMGLITSAVVIGMMLPSEEEIRQRVIGRANSRRVHPSMPILNSDGEEASVRIIDGKE